MSAWGGIFSEKKKEKLKPTLAGKLLLVPVFDINWLWRGVATRPQSITSSPKSSANTAGCIAPVAAMSYRSTSLELVAFKFDCGPHSFVSFNNIFIFYWKKIKKGFFHLKKIIVTSFNVNSFGAATICWIAVKIITKIGNNPTTHPTASAHIG